MKTTIFAICFLLLASFAGAVDVTQAVFTMASSAKTSTPNLRITPMTTRKLQIAQEGGYIQSFVWRAGATANYYLTKTQTVNLTDVLGIWVQVDQDTNVSVNSESATMKLPSGTDKVLIFK